MRRWLLSPLLVLLVALPWAQAASVRLMWEAPQTNTDGTPMLDLVDYHLHLGTAPGTYTQTISTGLTTTYEVPDLLPGTTYYSVVTALDTEGKESRVSGELQFNVPGLRPPASALAILYTWTLTATNEQGVKIQRKVDGGSYTTIGEVGKAVSSYLDEMVEPNHDYCYRSIAWNAIGTASSGAEVCTTTKPKPPTTKPAATKGGAAAIQVTP
jgi:hypothetical protein